MKTIDARGMSCPEPVVMMREALQSAEKSYKILVDSANAKENVSRFAQNSGYSVSVTEENGSYTILLSK